MMGTEQIAGGGGGKMRRSEKKREGVGGRGRTG